jgi:hypothetical protein
MGSPAPEKNPYMMEKMITPAAFVIPNMAKIKIPVPKLARIITFTAPNLSARILGKVRPNTEAAL